MTPGRRTPLLLAAGLLTACVIGASVAPTPYVTISPGGAYNTLGSVDGTPLITITGTTTYPTAGSLDLTTVTESGGPYGVVTVGDLVVSSLNSDVRVVPREQVFPDDVNPDDAVHQNAAAFDESQWAAIAAAMKHLSIPTTTTVVVVEVSRGGPSDGKLHAGDAIVAVNGTAVRSSEELGRLVRQQPVGSSITLRVKPEQSGAETDVTVVTAPRPDQPTTPYMGVVTAGRPTPPFTIDIELAGVGGPSAGLMLSMGIVDKLTPGQLNGGRNVAGTGTISDDGAVGPIGGIAQKLVGARSAGAELFLAPRDNCDEVVGHIPEGLTVVPVTSLEEGISVTRDWVAGRRVGSCPS